MTDIQRLYSELQTAVGATHVDNPKKAAEQIFLKVEGSGESKAYRITEKSFLENLWAKIVKLLTGSRPGEYAVYQDITALKQEIELASINDEQRQELLNVINAIAAKIAPSTKSPKAPFSLREWKKVAPETAVLDGIQDAKVFTHDNGTLVLVGGDIASHFLQTNPVGAVVNAANDTMYHGGGGTNQALSEVYSKDSWEAKGQAYLQQHNKDKLAISECAAVVAPAKKANVKKGAINAQYLFHALGPKVKQKELQQAAQAVGITEALKPYQQDIYKAYKNIFSECRRLNLSSVQLTRISTGIFSQSLSPNELQEWQNLVDQALFQAMSEAFQQEPKLTVVLVGYGSTPWTQY